MDIGDLILGIILAIIVGEATWIGCITKKNHRLNAMLSRADAKVQQHRALVNELAMLIQDDADLDKCLQDEIDGKALTRARDVEYEQNKARYDAEYPESPWVPKVSPK